MNEYVEIPQPHEINTKERERSLAAYFMMFATSAAGLPLPFLNFLASLFYYYFIKNTSRFTHFHSLQSLLSQIPVSIFNGIAVVGIVRVFYFDFSMSDTFIGYLIAVAFANFIYIVFSLIAAFKAYKGRMYYFIFFGQIAYNQAFKYRGEQEEKIVENRPPKQ